MKRIIWVFSAGAALFSVLALVLTLTLLVNGCGGDSSNQVPQLPVQSIALQTAGAPTFSPRYLYKQLAGGLYQGTILVFFEGQHTSTANLPVQINNGLMTPVSFTNQITAIKNFAYVPNGSVSSMPYKAGPIDQTIFSNLKSLYGGQVTAYSDPSVWPFIYSVTFLNAFPAGAMFQFQFLDNALNEYDLNVNIPPAQ